MKLLVIDPRRTEVANRAALHLQPYPGEDPVILAGMLRVIIDEGLHDQAFCAEHVDNLETLFCSKLIACVYKEVGILGKHRKSSDFLPKHFSEEYDEYLDLQAARFGDRLDVRIDVGAEALPVQVPSFLLQPLVENALRHGLARKTGRMTLDVRCRISGDTLLVEVCDDGAGLPPGFDVARDGGTGLRNIRSRLQQLYGSAAQLGIDAATGGGTRVSVRLPAAHATALSKVSA